MLTDTTEGGMNKLNSDTGQNTTNQLLDNLNQALIEAKFVLKLNDLTNFLYDIESSNGPPKLVEHVREKITFLETQLKSIRTKHPG